jgi:hypothetical protein
MHATMEVINLVTEYTPGLLMMQFGKQLNEFKDRVTVLVNALQQLHHRQLAINLFILNGNSSSIGSKERSNALATKLSDYYQMETMYVRTVTLSSFCMYLAPKKLNY